MNNIKKFIKEFTDEEIENITKQGRRYFLTKEQNQKIAEQIKTEPYANGLFLGEQKKEFKPSPALIDLIAKKSNKKIIINKKAEWLFLCGRDVFEDSIIKQKENQGLMLVQNEKDENLGYGRLMKKGKKSMLKNLLDKGTYLRNQN